MPSSTLEGKTSDQLLIIGELTRRTGVATPTLRYDEELGLLPTTESRNPYESGRKPESVHREHTRPDRR